VPGETIQDAVIGQRDELRRRPDVQNRQAIRPAAIGLSVLGIALLAFWYATDDRSVVSALLLLAGVTVLALAIMLYFLSPSKSLRDDVSDALAISSVTDVDMILSSLLIEGRGIYMPASDAGATKVFIPASIAPGETPSSGKVFVTGPSKGILLDPPGYGLLSCARRISPPFTDEGLANEITDLMESGLELAHKVAVRREGDRVTVSMTGLVNAGLCATVRKESPKLCTRIGCPICSFAACMIADGTRRRVRIEGVEIKGKTVHATFEML
jgi:hypothetical protein